MCNTQFPNGIFVCCHCRCRCCCSSFFFFVLLFSEKKFIVIGLQSPTPPPPLPLPSWPSIICEQCFPRNMPNDAPTKKEKKISTNRKTNANSLDYYFLQCSSLSLSCSLHEIIERRFFTIKRCLCFAFASVMCVCVAAGDTVLFTLPLLLLLLLLLFGCLRFFLFDKRVCMHT